MQIERMAQTARGLSARQFGNALKLRRCRRPRSRRRALAVAELFVKPFDETLRRLGDHRSRRKNCVGAGGAERRKVLLGDDAADYDHSLAHSGLAERALQRWHQRKMSRRERRDADNMDPA